MIPLKSSSVDLQGLTLTQDIDGVPFTELQVLWALSSIVIERHHLVKDGTIGQRVFCLKYNTGK